MEYHTLSSTKITSQEVHHREVVLVLAPTSFLFPLLQTQLGPVEFRLASMEWSGTNLREAFFRHTALYPHAYHSTVLPSSRRQFPTLDLFGNFAKIMTNATDMRNGLLALKDMSTALDLNQKVSNLAFQLLKL